MTAPWCRWLAAAVAATLIAPAAWAQTADPSHLEIKWVRDSEEYWTLTRQIYRMATEAVARERGPVPRGDAWGVVLDIDETVLDNSAYQLEVAAYRTRFDTLPWNAFVRRGTSPAVPGAVEFVRAVREAGGRIAYNSNREERVREATRRNLEAEGLWKEGDLLCLLSGAPGDSKASRRAQVVTGEGQCAWRGAPLIVLAYVGDQMVDFPRSGEPGAAAEGESLFGRRYFLLPQPMYGDWVGRVTRPGIAR